MKDPNPKIGFGTGSGVVNDVGGVGVKEPLPPITGGTAGGEVKEPLGIEGSPIVNEPLAASPGGTADGEVKEQLGTEGCPAVNEPLAASPSLETLGPSAVAGSDIDISRGKACNEGAGTARGANASGVATKELGIWRGPGAVLMAAWKLVPCRAGDCNKFVALGRRLVNGIGSGLGSLASGVGDIERANG